MSVNQQITCRAAVLYEEGKPLVIEQVIIEPPKNDQVRVKMVSAGICASDAHFVWGQKVSDFEGHSLPIVLGHEGAAIVESVGANVTTLKPGDYVLTTFMPQCKKCSYCSNPLTNLCSEESLFQLASFPNKKQLNGTPLFAMGGLGIYSEYALLKTSQVVKIDQRVSNLQNACILSCAVGTGFFSATNLANVQPGTTAAVWGLGAIGLNTVYGCKYAGAKKIIGVDINNDKKAVALEFGCTEFVNPRELDKPLEQYLLEKYGGVDYAFDCLGNKMVIDTASKSISPFGTFVAVGLPPKETNLVYPVMELLSGRKLIGGFFGNKTPDEGLQQLVQMYLDGQYNIDRLVSNRFTLDQINEAFQTLKNGKCIRSLIIFDDK